MTCDRFGCRRVNRLFLLIAIGSSFSLVFCYNLILRQSWKSFETFETEKEFSRRVANSPKSTPLPELFPEDFYIRMLTVSSPNRGDLFDPTINATELRDLLKVLWKFLDACEQHNITVIMHRGTLLGSYRHHGVIPWDDGVNVLVDTNDKANLNAALKRIPELFVTMEKRANSVWRVSRKSVCLHKSKLGCWPFIGIAFYKLQNGTVYDLTTPDCNFPANVTFPLHKRPFMGRWINSPKDALKFLSFLYKPSDLCISSHFSHKLGDYFLHHPKSISCKNLRATYPFVSRVSDSAPSCQGVLETLSFHDSQPIYTVPVNEPMSVINTEYSTLQNKTWENMTRAIKK